MIEVTNSFMIPFLKLFVVEVGNVIFTFATNIYTPNDLVTHVRQFFRPARRGNRSATNLSSAVDDGADDTSVEENEDSDIDDDDDTDSSGDACGVTVVTNHATKIQQLDTDNEEDRDNDVIVALEEGETVLDKAENFFDSGASSDAHGTFKSSLGCDDVTSACGCALNLIEFLQLGKTEKGALTIASKHNSRNGRWFGQKPKKDVLVEDSGDTDLCVEETVELS